MTLDNRPAQFFCRGFEEKEREFEQEEREVTEED